MTVHHQRFGKTCFAVALLVLIAVLAEMAQSKAMTDNSAPVVPFKRNVRQSVEQMRCAKPQKRLVYLEDAYEGYQPRAMYFPRAALVHRCDKSTGCCLKVTDVCSPAETRTMTFVFQEAIIGGRKRNIKVNLTDHLSCECQSALWDAPRR